MARQRRGHIPTRRIDRAIPLSRSGMEPPDVMSAWMAAKTANPKLTQGEFARKAMPTISARYEAAETDAQRRKIEQSGARYLRLIREGKRTGRVNVVQASKFIPGQGSDQFNVRIRDSSGNVRSFNLNAVGARSQLNIPELEARIRDHPELLYTKAQEWSRRYAVKESDLQIEDFELRRVLVERKAPRVINLRTGNIVV